MTPQFVGLGLLGESIGRIGSEVRRRPQLSVRTEIGGEGRRATEGAAQAADGSTEVLLRSPVP